MASMDAAAAEIAATLTMEDIPMKLRCSVCSQLALGAVRMPCCDQNICENCEASLDNECPVCLHANVDKELLKPNKALRTTIKAFLKKKTMERDNLRKREEANKPRATTPAAPTVVEVPTETPVQLQLATAEASGTDNDKHVEVANGAHLDSGDGAKLGTDNSTEDQMDIPRPSIENASDNVRPSEQSTGDANGEEKKESGALGTQGESAESKAMNGEWPANGMTGMMSNGALGFGGMNGQLPMDFSQMMPFMPNMGAFPNMMSMPGIGIDPTMAMTHAMTQQMYGGFGGAGVGMNGMNMGMGFNAGQGAYGGFNGQLDGWTAGQDNYNANAYGPNGMGGNFGAQGGYNMSSHQGNFNQMNHQQYPNNDYGYNNHGYQNRGRGRRGYYNAGRGQRGYGAMNQGNLNGPTNYEPFHHQLPPQMSQQGSTQQGGHTFQQQNGAQEEQNTAESKDEPEPQSLESMKAAEEQMNKELNPGDENDEPAAETVPPSDQAQSEQAPKEPQEAEEQLGLTNDVAKGDDNQKKPSESAPLPIETFISSGEARMGKLHPKETPVMSTSMHPPVGPAVPQGPAARHSQEPSHDSSGWGRGVGRGTFRGRGEYRGRGAGYGAYANGIHSSSTTSATPIIPPVEPMGLGVAGAPTGPKALREGLPNTSIRGGRGFSIVGRAHTVVHPKPADRPRSRSRSPERQRTRSRSPATSQHRSSHHKSHRHRSRSVSDEEDRERRKERRHRRSHKYEDEVNGNHDDNRPRDASVESASRKSTHRSHRHHHDKESGSSSHRHHRDRSRGREERDKDEDRKSRKRRSRSPITNSNSIVQTPTSMTAPELPNGFDKEDSRKRRDRDRDRDDEDRHRERKRSRRDRSPTPTEDRRASHKPKDRDDTRETKPSSDLRRESIAEIHNSRRDSLPSTSIPKGPSQSQPSKPIPTGPKASRESEKPPRGPEKDLHQLEREARNRERLMKELQRRAATEGTGPKRKGSATEGRSAAAAGGLEGRIGGRRVSYKYEDEDDEARTQRVEKEREAARWG